MQVDHLTLLAGVITSLIASSGFWLYIIKRIEIKNNNQRLLIGLAHDRIVFLCTRYIKRGNITHDEYENLHNFLYEPYKDVGGNGSARRLMEEVNKLPFVSNQLSPEEKGEMR